MKNAYVGTYFTTLKDAQEDVKKKEKETKRKFVIFQVGNGYLVVSEKQFK